MTSAMGKVKHTVTAILLLITAHAWALDVPPRPDRLVNDYAQMLSSSEVGSLERKLVAYDDSTSTQIAVVTIPSLDGDDLFDYAQRVAEAWGIGGGENDNGILLLIVSNEKKIRIHTGYGVEGGLTDALSKRIIEQEMKPAFKQARFYEGMDNATSAMIMALAGEYQSSGGKKGGKQIPAFVVILVLFLIFFVFGGRRRYTGYGHSGRRYYGGPFIGGFGGGSSGFGGGGGGFGGFGGGSFGGGGASGGW